MLAIVQKLVFLGVQYGALDGECICYGFGGHASQVFWVDGDWRNHELVSRSGFTSLYHTGYFLYYAIQLYTPIT